VGGERGFFEITRANIAEIDAVVNRNLLLVRYSFERLAKSFKRGELQRGWGEKVTIQARKIGGIVLISLWYSRGG
jgi:hypothetical protein